MVAQRRFAGAVGALALAGLLLRPALAADAGTAAGALTQDSRTVKLTTAYAREERVIPELDVGDPNPHIAVILVDRALPEAATRSELALVQLASSSAIVGLVVEIDPATGNIFAGKSFLPQGGSPQFFTQTPGSGKFASDGFKLAAGRASGHVRTTKPVDVTNPDGTTAGNYSFDAAFDAPIAPAPKLLATLAGDQARASDPARAIRRYLDAVAKGDLPAIRASLASDHPFAAMVTAENLPQMKQEMLGPYVDGAAMMADLQKAYIYPAQAQLFFKGAQGGMVMPMVLEGGSWKVSTP
jgi:hypothetical protein